MKRTIDSFFVPSARASVSVEGQKDKDDETTAETAETVNEPELKKKTYTFRREWLSQFPWLRHSKEENVMFCMYCKECGKTMAGNTSFVTGCNTFRIETLKKHSASAKHISCRDKCTAQVSPLPDAFQRQTAANRSAEEAEMIAKFNIAYNIAREELPFTKFRSEVILHKKKWAGYKPNI